MNSVNCAELYRFEWEQRAHLTSSVNIPIVGVSALATVIATILIGYPQPNGIGTTIFHACVFAASAALVTALIFILLSLLWVEYKKMPSPVILRHHYRNLTSWHLQNGNTEADAERDFQDSFDDQLAIASQANSLRNKFRGNCIFLATALVAFALIPLGVAGGIYVKASINQPEKIYAVRVLTSNNREGIK